MVVQGMVDHEKLGLRRVMVVIDFAKEYRTYAETILTAMSELCYVVSFERLFPSGTYNVAASVPAEPEFALRNRMSSATKRWKLPLGTLARDGAAKRERGAAPPCRWVTHGYQ